ncbi:MAG: imipenem/basic amino acid-specific outer membrane pore [Sulfurimonas sp.]|jgi:imipenem/basic amino acid-specific outer membrane pore
MKKIILSMVAVMSIAGSVSAADTSADSIESALKDGKFTLDTRVFYYDKDVDGSSDATTSLTLGSIMKYTTKEYMGLTAGLAYFGSNSIGGLYSKDDGAWTYSLQSGSGDNINLLGEAYLQYNISNTMLKIGRQKLSTGVMYGNDLRTLPTAYEAAILVNKDIPDTKIEVGHVWANSGFTSSYALDGNGVVGFDDSDGLWGKSGLAYIYVTNNSIDGLSLSAEYIKALSDKTDAGAEATVSSYSYADAAYNVPIGTNTYIKAQYAGKSYNASGEDSGQLLGAKIGTSVSIVDLALVADVISDNEIYFDMGSPMYTDWQQGYSAYSPSTAFGGYLVVHPMSTFSLKGGYVDVSADNENGSTYADDYSEINFDAQYKINSISKFRVRYSIKDQTEESGKADSNDLRVIYYLSI